MEPVQLSPRRKNQSVLATQLELAYAAGFFDGEGAVMIWRKGGSKKDKSGRPYHRLQVSVTQTNRIPLEWLMIRFGGSIHVKNANPGTNEKPSWIWAISCEGAAEFLRAIYPYLVMKQDRVDVALRFRKLVALNVKTGEKGWTSIGDDLWSQREACRDELMRLNKRGVA